MPKTSRGQQPHLRNIIGNSIPVNKARSDIAMPMNQGRTASPPCGTSMQTEGGSVRAKTKFVMVKGMVKHIKMARTRQA